ncbi:hypothetical protein [Haloarchaeobius sp. HME9146]|uniref:hypothetical protein n=1 Tax=Haloarchaeobius sp. HME9146 TaxID=2978732 RepID=UPI0021C11357|nr:hypothetical protein [Haloarchaeobius sp. HME9146]MCT9095280.1 hypothetical protein [Haloarchaeobius sp. HME9146]
MSGGQVAFSFPLNVPQGEAHHYKQQIPEDATIEKTVVFFPVGTRTDLQVQLTVDGDNIMETEEATGSDSFGDYIVGSGTTYPFELSVQVFEGQNLGVKAENVSTSSDLDGFVSFTLNYGGGGV